MLDKVMDNDSIGNFSASFPVSMFNISIHLSEIECIPLSRFSIDTKIFVIQIR